MREIVTTFLEVLGILALVSGAFVVLDRFDMALAFSASGLLLIASSALLTWMSRPRGGRQ